MFIQQLKNTYIHTHTQTNSKPNCLNSLFPQNGYNVRIKAVHILKAPPFSDVLISLFKRVLNSKLAERVSDFNRFHFLLVRSFAISISIRSFRWQCNVFFLCPKLTKSTDIYFYYWGFNCSGLLSRADWKLITDFSNNVQLFIYLRL
jgi:hypothetical protein